MGRQGPTGICIFDGKMNAPMYTDILRETLLPFIKDVLPESHRFMQDNDLKHVQYHAMHRNSWLKMKSTGFEHRLNHQT